MFKLHKNWKITRVVHRACGCREHTTYSALMDTMEEAQFLQELKNSVCDFCEDRRIAFLRRKEIKY